MKKVKVVHLITRMELGGAQQNTLFTVSNLNTEKFQTFLVTGKGGELYEDAKALNNTFIIQDLIREIRPIKDLKALFQIIKILKQIKNIKPQNTPVIVHTHSSKAGILGRWAAKASGVSIIVHSIHGFGFNNCQPFWLRSSLIISELITSFITTMFIAVSWANMEKGVKLCIFPRKKIKLIRSGIEIAKFRNHEKTRHDVRQGLKIPEDVPVAAMISCLKPQKAPLDYVRACCLVKKDVPSCHFLLVGDGTLRPDIERQVSRADLQDSFHVLGWRRDIPEILSTINVLVLTSFWEGLPRVLPQAMAAGVPIVATDVDGSSEAVRDGLNGFLVSPGDISGIAKKTAFLLTNPEKAREMGEKGTGLVKEFDIHKMVSDQEKLYDELLARTLQPR